MSAPLDQDADLATSIVHFVQRTGEVVVIGDIARAGAFAGDPHLLAHPHRSILGLAMLHQGRLIGALYLENEAAREAFTPARVEIARVLAAQAAIAVENARMVAELRRRTDALSLAKDRLEQELLEREAAEAARQELKEELNRVQTPIIPITDRVMVMPLIGTIDAERARQVLETSLAGAQKSRAAVVILDVTGVEMVDAGVTGSLVSTASALRLLGAQAVITGIRPDIAQSLVALNVDLRGVVTLGTLQSGIAYAMDRLKSRRL
jgi:anti-anti-sigma regulatory factor